MNNNQSSKRSTSVIRIYESDKLRFDELQRRLTIENKGNPISQAKVLKYLLSINEAREERENLGTLLYMAKQRDGI